MGTMKAFAAFSIILLLLTGCAVERSLERREEGVTLQPGSFEREDGSAEKLRALEQSLSILQSEVAALERRLNSLQVRPRLSTYKLPQNIDLCGERFPLEDRNVWESLDREFLLALDNEAQVLLWMKRAKRYFPFIEKRLTEMGLPDDLKYLTITESGLRPLAVSSSGASGIWQFIPSTAEKYGMKKNRSVDERFDFLKATEGALAYLKCLYEEFQSWTLAMAAYNAGENRVRKEIELQETRNYFYLDLPTETERYVYKIAVAKIILSDPEQFGFRLEPKEFYDPFVTERVKIELVQPLPIMEVARAVGSYYKEIKEMNLHFTEETIPPGVHFLNLPPGSSDRFWTFFSMWKKELESK
ncbi:MAG: lytic transglycosylase domain-containing protein [Syntrophaceae bacterium]|nr:lytic transglycosylase domain-containing protein [Syntrophaceae bacterium]